MANGNVENKVFPDLLSHPWQEYYADILLDQYGPKSHYSKELHEITTSNDFSNLKIKIAASLESKDEIIKKQNEDHKNQGWSPVTYSTSEQKEIICTAIKNRLREFVLDPLHQERKLVFSLQKESGHLLKVCAAYKLHLYANIREELIKVLKKDKKMLAEKPAGAENYQEIATLFTANPEQYIQESKDLPVINSLNIKKYPVSILLENETLKQLDNYFNAPTNEQKVVNSNLATLLEKLDIIRNIEKAMQLNISKHGKEIHQTFDDKLLQLRNYFDTDVISCENVQETLSKGRDPLFFAFFAAIRRFINYYLPHPFTASTISSSEGGVRFGQMQKIFTKSKSQIDTHLQKQQKAEQELEEQSQQAKLLEYKNYKSLVVKESLWATLNTQIINLKSDDFFKQLVGKWELTLENILIPNMTQNNSVPSLEDARKALEALQANINLAIECKTHFTQAALKK